MVVAHEILKSLPDIQDPTLIDEVLAQVRADLHVARAREDGQEADGGAGAHTAQGHRVRAAVAQLPAKQRAALIMRTYQELSHQEIASALGTSVGAARAAVMTDEPDVEVAAFRRGSPRRSA